MSEPPRTGSAMFGRSGKKTRKRIEPRLNWRGGSAPDELRADPADRPPTSRRTKKSASRPAARAGRRRRSWLGRFVYWGAVLSVWGLISTVALVVYYASQLPPIDQLAVPKRPPNIAILADDGSLIANRGDTGGPAIRLIDLPPYLPKAFVAIEDRRFYDHIGIDPLGVSRALMRDAVGRSGHRGRLDADPAAGEEPVPDPGAHAVAQDPGGDPGVVARAPVFEGPDPRALSQPRLFRFGRLWGRGGGAEIFRQERPLRHPAGSRAAGGAHEVADQACAQPQPRGRQRARGRGHHRDGRAGPHHRGDGQVGARQPGAGGPRQGRRLDQLRRRLCHGLARRHGRRDRRRHRGDDHDRSQDAGGGRAGADRRAQREGRQVRRRAGGAGGARSRGRGQGDGRRTQLRRQPVQPRGRGQAPARLLVQAVRLSGGAGEGPDARTPSAKTRRFRSKDGIRRTTRANISDR